MGIASKNRREIKRLSKEISDISVGETLRSRQPAGTFKVTNLWYDSATRKLTFSYNNNGRIVTATV